MKNFDGSLITSCGLFLSKLQTLYDEMDRKYAEAASYYGFHCSGCDDTCCSTKFYHHTILEILYILKGFQTLPQDQQADIKKNAEKICIQTQEAERAGKSIRLLCPVNDGVRCSIYPFRPMICRLHGIPHEFKMPGAGVQFGPGCRIFQNTIKDKPYTPFDRTILYSKMAKLESDVRNYTGILDKYKLTVAQILLI